MKKITMWLMSTLTAVVLLFGYHTSTSTSAAAQGGNASVAVPATTGSSSTSSSTGTSSSTSTSSSTAAGSTSSGTTSSTGTTTVTGSAAQTRYGPVEVQLTITNGTITAVKVLEYPNSSGKDQEINARALPILVQETLKAQSSKIDMVSGATYTSTGYETSLQSALDKAGL